MALYEIKTGDINIRTSPLIQINPDFPRVTMAEANQSLAMPFRDMKHCPMNGGHWENGERGDGRWVPDRDTIPGKSNPEENTWNDILGDYNIEDIPFQDGYPDFSEISKGDVEIEPFTESRDDNFDLADIKLAEQRGCTPDEVRQWRKEHKYTWHECQDMKTMQKVPSIVHNNVSHSGGISAAKKEAVA